MSTSKSRVAATLTDGAGRETLLTLIISVQPLVTGESLSLDTLEGVPPRFKTYFN